MPARVRGAGANGRSPGRADQRTATGTEERGYGQPGHGPPALIQRIMVLLRLARWVGFALLAAAVLLIGTWCALAIWFRYAGGDKLLARTTSRSAALQPP